MRMPQRPRPHSRFRLLAFQLLLLLGSAAGVACEDDPDDLNYLRGGTGGFPHASGGHAGQSEAGSGAAGSAGEGADQADAG